ncbi:HNH endonuclease [Kitasatospora sp. NPDC059408]|uniref:HNH endonuclease n=1 Tax=Kitasatospora sp. NPDC059408 TaxID=3346823 RepID=UPI0036A4A26D
MVRNTRSVRARRAVIAAGTGAAARMRKAIRKAGHAHCAACGLRFLGSAVDVDHIKPIAHGGQDVDGNVQALCRPCHKLKTRRDFDFKKPPF